MFIRIKGSSPRPFSLGGPEIGNDIQEEDSLLNQALVTRSRTTTAVLWGNRSCSNTVQQAQYGVQCDIETALDTGLLWGDHASITFAKVKIISN